MPKRKLPPNDVVIEMYDSGMSSGEIAERCDVAPVTVVSLLRRIGHPRRTAQEAAGLRDSRGRSKPVAYWTGRKQSPEMVEKRIAKIRGPNHYLWKGGKSRRPYRNIVDKTNCEICNGDEFLGIHHIDLDHYNNATDNLQVLCNSCHMGLHKRLYWAAIRAGHEPPKGTGPIGWKTERANSS